MSLKNKLNRLKGHMSLDSSPKQPSTPERVLEESGENIIPYLDKWMNISAIPRSFEDDYIFVRETVYPLDYQHGKYRFEELYQVVDAWNQSESSHPLSTRDRKVEDLLFFDTETTGLSHGVGNTIFLLGCCRIQDGKLTVKQYFMPGPESEVAFYHAFLQDMDDLKNLVTYNGKAFDWPQVKTRHTLIRDVVPKLPQFGHYDLLHGARRLWKNSLESCRLSLIEQHILGVTREDDIPGYLAPMLYFDFLKEKDPEGIQGVLLHNEVDMLSLVTLYIHVSNLLLNRSKDELKPSEFYELGRWYEYIGEEEAAFSFYKKGFVVGGEYETKLMSSLAGLHKKRGEIDQAVKLWKMVENNTKMVHSALYIELAKVYEHHYKDYDQALHYALKAMQVWKQENRLLRGKRKQENEQFAKRIERLESKCKVKSD